MLTTLAASYCGPAPLPDNFWGRWNFDPWLLAVMALATAMFWMQQTTARQRLAFAAAMASLAVIFISPLCALTVALFSARVVHHVLLVAIAAPLLALAFNRWRGAGPLLTPLTLLHTVIFWLWHAPDAYSLALQSTPIYWLMQLTLLGSATLMWAAIFTASPARSMASLLFLTIQMGLLGALLVFSMTSLYVPHLATTQAFGLEPLADQQLAGLIMWVPASVPYLAVALLRLMAWLRQGEHHPA